MKWASLIISLVCFLFIIPLIAGNRSDLKLNQFYIERLNRAYGNATWSDQLDSFLSTYSLALNNLITPIPSEVDVNEPDSVFNFVYASLPSRAIVHPSEMYYYWTFTKDNQTISGNLRLVEARNGKIGLGYFDVSNQDFAKHKLFGTADGLIIEKESEFVYHTTYLGKTVRFSLNNTVFDQPATLPLAPGDQFVTRVTDESGIILLLYFNQQTKSFYYLLDERIPVTDDWSMVTDKIMVGQRTGFAFFQDQDLNRKILFGVSAKKIYSNSYFDGPFDQVYPFADLKEKIYQAYPYTQYGGVDQYGNFLDRDGVRVAISPYIKYSRQDDLVATVEHCVTEKFDKPELYECLTHEEKKDFHLDSPLFNQDGSLRSNR